MPQLCEVLKEKEIAIARLREEIDALRLVCPLLQDDGGFHLTSAESGEKSSDFRTEENTEPELKGHESERAVCLARIRAQLADTSQSSAIAAGGRNVLLQFRQAAVGASRALLKRVSYRRSSKIRPQRRTIRGLFERLGRSNAA